MRYEFHPEAELELYEAASRYESDARCNMKAPSGCNAAPPYCTLRAEGAQNPEYPARTRTLARSTPENGPFFPKVGHALALSCPWRRFRGIDQRFPNPPYVNLFGRGKTPNNVSNRDAPNLHQFDTRVTQ